MRAFIAISLLIFIPTVQSEIYRWTDTDGKIHFSDQPPEDSTLSEEVSQTMPPINRDASSEETKKLQLIFQGETPEEQNYHRQQKVQQRRQDQITKRACDQAKYNLKVLKGRVYFEDAQGNEIIVTEEQREQRAQQLEGEITKHCT